MIASSECIQFEVALSIKAIVNLNNLTVTSTVTAIMILLAPVVMPDSVHDNFMATGTAFISFEGIGF